MGDVSIMLFIVAWFGFGVGYFFRQEREKMIQREREKKL